MNAKKHMFRTPSPLGTILLVANPHGDALSGLYLEGQKYFPAVTDSFRESPRLPLFRDAATQLNEYFTGTRTGFDLPLAPEGTAFQRDVWSAISKVPFGATISYGELARRCAHPSAVRAAGAATGRNPLTIVVPCPRIMGSGGALTGYAGGVERKRALLALEARYASRSALDLA